MVQPEKQWVQEDRLGVLISLMFYKDQVWLLFHFTAELYPSRRHRTPSSSRWPASQRQVSGVFQVSWRCPHIWHVPSTDFYLHTPTHRPGEREILLPQNLLQSPLFLWAVPQQGTHCRASSVHWPWELCSRAQRGEGGRVRLVSVWTLKSSMGSWEFPLINKNPQCKWANLLKHKSITKTAINNRAFCLTFNWDGKTSKQKHVSKLALHNCVLALSLALIYQTKISQTNLETSADSGVKIILNRNPVVIHEMYFLASSRVQRSKCW